MGNMALALLLLFFSFANATTNMMKAEVGVNYGQLANNLPTPQKVRELLQTTTIGKVKIYDSNPAIIEAFANTGIDFIVMVKNEQIESLLDPKAAQKWVSENVASYMPATQIKIISVGNEILSGNDSKINSQVLPVIQNVHTALVNLRIDNQVKVSTPHSLAVLSSSYPPSSGAFQKDLTDTIIKPMLQFLSETGAPFMVNTYPFFAYRNSPRDVSLAYALFFPNAGVVDPKTHLRYFNLFDAQIDAVYAAMAKLGFQNIEVMVSETGWPSLGDAAEIGASVQNAMAYNKNLIDHISSKGTPMRPNKLVETYIFALFNENQKPGPTTERNFGLFHPDMSTVYDVGLLRNGPTFPIGAPYPPSQNLSPPSITLPPPPAETLPPPTIPVPVPSNPAPSIPAPSIPAPSIPAPSNPAPSNPAPSNPTPSNPSPGGGGTRIWCISKPGADVGGLQTGLDFACGEGGADCSAIREGSSACFLPDTLQSHASFAFNSYFHKHGRNFWNCYFNNNALLTVSDPSYGACIYPSQ